jgi:hypothetical protein
VAGKEGKLTSEERHSDAKKTKRTNKVVAALAAAVKKKKPSA